MSDETAAFGEAVARSALRQRHGPSAKPRYGPCGGAVRTTSPRRAHPAGLGPLNQTGPPGVGIPQRAACALARFRLPVDPGRDHPVSLPPPSPGIVEVGQPYRGPHRLVKPGTGRLAMREGKRKGGRRPALGGGEDRPAVRASCPLVERQAWASRHDAGRLAQGDEPVSVPDSNAGL